MEKRPQYGQRTCAFLNDVYSKRARFCVVFLSKAYAAKLWTQHEFKAAQARAFADSAEYILPARFDDTEIPGLLGIVAYVDLRSKTPDDVARLVKAKLDGTLASEVNVQSGSDHCFSGGCSHLRR